MRTSGRDGSGTGRSGTGAIPSAAGVIVGGFVLVPVASLMVAWRACRTRPLGVGDFRAWLACREMVARRRGAESRHPADGRDRPASRSARAPIYAVDELAKLLGVAGKRARASVRRLEVAGLLEWSGPAIGFPDRPLEVDGPVADSIGGGRGSVAIPRRVLRLLAGGARPALIATTLGILLRCLGRRKGGFDGRGRVKASWIARAFDVDERRVKASRRELVAIGWVEPIPSAQRAENRWGRAYRIDLAWSRVGLDGRRLPPPPAEERPEIATPSVDQDPLAERQEDQEPAGRGPAGVEVQGQGGPTPGSLPAPDLDDVRPEDLRDTGRALRLHDQAVARGLASPSEDGRLKFLAIAEHARVVGTSNPGGLFARLVRRGWWHFATQDDEDEARRRLRDHLRRPADGPPGVDRPRARTSPGASSGPPSLGMLLSVVLAGRGIAPP